MRLDPALLPQAPDLSLETALWSAGVGKIAGIDEAGRGALAGPVAAGAVVLPPDSSLGLRMVGLRDSKEMNQRQRERWAAQVQTAALAWAVAFASSEEIDTLGILPATRLAASRAVIELGVRPDHLLLDYLLLPDRPEPQTSLIKGDARSLSIAAASVLAKVVRDRHMCARDREYPIYGFARHKGYGTQTHRDILQKYGPCPLHRNSFTLVRLQPEP